jgi:hypothetical protein
MGIPCIAATQGPSRTKCIISVSHLYPICFGHGAQVKACVRKAWVHELIDRWFGSKVLPSSIDSIYVYGLEGPSIVALTLYMYIVWKVPPSSINSIYLCICFGRSRQTTQPCTIKQERLTPDPKMNPNPKPATRQTMDTHRRVPRLLPETNKTHLVLFGMNYKTFGPCFGSH